MKIEGRVGIAIAQDGTSQPIRLTRLGGLVSSDGHAKYAEPTTRGYIFSTCMSASMTFPAGSSALTPFATTTPGFTLYNPLGSGRNLAIVDVELIISGVPALPSAIALTVNSNPGAAAPTSANTLTPINNFIGTGPKSIASVFFGGGVTLPAACSPIRFFGFVSSGSVGSGGNQGYVPGPINHEVAGAIILGPGTALSVVPSTAINAALSMTWEEMIP